MAVLLQLLGEQWFLGLLQLIAGKVIKKAWGGGLNPYIPAINVLLAVLGFTLMPASASAAGFGPFGPVLNVFASALLQTIMVTGTHSTFKNTVIPAGKFTLGWLADKLLNR